MMSQEHKTNKIRDFLFGFLGWFLAGNTYYAAFLLLYLIDTSDFTYKFFMESEVGYYLFGTITIAVICILFIKKRKWLAYGILAACTANAVAWVIMDGNLLYGLEYGFLRPLPAGGIFGLF